LADSSNASRVELVAAILLAVIEVGSAIAEFKFDFRPRGWLPVLGVFLAFFLPTLALIITALLYKGRPARILTVPLIFIGLAASIFFLPIWGILLYCNLFHQKPDPNGDELVNHPVAKIPVIANDQTADYGFSFDREANYAEVFFRPDHPDKDRISKINLNLFKVPSLDVKDRFHGHPVGATEIKFDVDNPSPSLTATVRFQVVPVSNAQPPFSLLASYTYRRHDRWWRIRRWVFREFDRQ